jgi:hypothetical protein
VSKVNGVPRLVWTASTDNVAVAGYRVHRSTDGSFGGSVATVTSGLEWNDAGAVEGVQYTYAVVAYDAAGNDSPRSVLRKIKAGVAPTAPAGLTATASPGSVALNWTAATDNVGVVGYIVYRSTSQSLGPEIARTIGASATWADTTTVPGTRYTYAVKAYDAGGYVGGRSNYATVTAR